MSLYMFKFFDVIVAETSAKIISRYSELQSDIKQNGAEGGNGITIVCLNRCRNYSFDAFQSS